MFASWDCKHFAWKNCPVSLAGQYKGKEGAKTLILEAICDPDLYIWHSYFGDAGSLNDLNVLARSGIVRSILDGTLDLRTEPYTVNGTQRDWLYFLVDGIYPKWAILSIHIPIL
jgi:Plant transposon protein